MTENWIEQPQVHIFGGHPTDLIFCDSLLIPLSNPFTYFTNIEHQLDSHLDSVNNY